MLQLKVFYSIPEGVNRCEVIFTESIIQNFEDLMQVIRGKIESLQFIPDTELQVLYTDDENTLVTIRPNDSFHDAWRCASKVQGTTLRRLKIKIMWQPKSTPELISAKRQQMREGSETDRDSKRKLKFGCSKHLLLLSTPKSLPNTSSEDDLIPDVGTSKTYLSPPRKQQHRVSTGDLPENSALNRGPRSNHYMSPLDLLIPDKQEEVKKERKKVAEKEEEVQRLMARYSKHAGIDYSKPSCTNCHRRERHNRVNCPYKAHPCQSAEFCGDLSKHKDEKDVVSRTVNELNNAKKGLEKLQNTLSMKIALKNQTSNSFSSLMRSRLINECKPRYLNTQGFENWRQVNMDLKKLESHFKGKIPPVGVSLLEALTEYDKKIVLESYQVPHQGNPVRTLWELKGIKWPSETPEPLQYKPVDSPLSFTFSESYSTGTELQPLTVEEEEEQLAPALKESNLYLRGTQTKPSATITRATLSTSEGNDDNERTELNDAANALLNLSKLSSN